MTVINVVTCGFSGEDLNWLARVTVRLQPTVWLQVSDYSQLSDYRCPITANCLITLSDYNFADKLEQTTPVYVPVTYEEIAIVTIKRVWEWCDKKDHAFRKTEIDNMILKLFKSALYFLNRTLLLSLINVQNRLE